MNVVRNSLTSQLKRSGFQGLRRPVKAVDILGRSLNDVNGKFKSLEEFTLEDNDKIHTELEGRKMCRAWNEVGHHFLGVLAHGCTKYNWSHERWDEQNSRKAWKLEDICCSTKIGSPGSRLPRTFVQGNLRCLRDGELLVELGQSLEM